ncbi:hypothetical protein [Rufibacter psychrotolerans]|uniref:hypothetical protein n=1 Tax=Rufibacter psychrotolerans TaxID=2812556 RepID=UPI001966DA36|nr:hypothetical protein [Rufibacter sp. SYSU D00308]
MNKFLTVAAGIACCVFTCTLEAVAQGVEVSASPQNIGYVGRTYNGIAGSPYLFPDWANGRVKMANGTVYEGLKLRYDQLNDELIFTLEDGRPKAFMHPVQEFTIKNESTAGVIDERLFRNGFAAIDGATEKSFYEVLQEGKTSLVKRTTKAIVEERAAGNRYATKQIKPTERYYLAIGPTLTKIRKDKKALLGALPDQAKAKQVEKFISDRKLNLKHDSALAQAVAHYNSL